MDGFANVAPTRYIYILTPVGLCIKRHASNVMRHASRFMFDASVRGAKTNSRPILRKEEHHAN
jgi:hypothetical protein